LIVDEAQNLDESVLETVRMLSNFETHNTKLLQIILAGQPGLATKLAQPRSSQLRQRFTVLTRLEPLTVEETGLYIKHRLKVAGFRGDPIFEPHAIAAIAQRALGIPRNINSICYNALSLSYAQGRRVVTAEIAQAAAAQLDVGFLHQGCRPFPTSLRLHQAQSLLPLLLALRDRCPRPHLLPPRRPRSKRIRKSLTVRMLNILCRSGLCGP
jgi:MSHA biogenesis protein MshM